jgi:hypothetical protein
METVTVVKGEEAMTDFQFKALMAMVLEIVEHSEDWEEVKTAIRKLATGRFDEDERE